MVSTFRKHGFNIAHFHTHGSTVQLASYFTLNILFDTVKALIKVPVVHMCAGAVTTLLFDTPQISLSVHLGAPPEHLGQYYN